MTSHKIPLTELIDQKMSYISQRQAVLAQNIANIDTPNYKAKDLKKPDFNKMVEESNHLPVTRTHSSHFNAMSPVSASYALIAQEITSETKPNGNNVSLEDQMKEVSISGMDYQLVIGLNRKWDKSYNIAIGKPSSTE